MAQLRRDYEQFINHDAEIIVIGPEDSKAFNSYFQKENLPFIGIPDPDHGVLKLFGQKVNLFKLGRMPGQIIVDKHCNFRFIHDGHDMADSPQNEEILAILDNLNAEQD